MSRRLVRGSALALLLAAGCGGDKTSVSTEGDLLVSYFQSGPEPGAILLTVSGGPITSVSATGAQQVSSSSLYAATTRVLVLGSFANGDLLRLRVPDTSRVASYSVHVDQVADKTTFALIDPSQYTFTVHR